MCKMSRAYVFTYYQPLPPAEKYDHLQENIPSKVKAIVMQLEECPTSGRIHIQGFVRFKQPVRKPQAQQILNMPQTHFDPAHGTDQENIVYCNDPTKILPGTLPFKWGTFSSQGARSDLTSLYESVKAGTFTLDDHYTTVAKYGKFFDRIVSIHSKPPAFRADLEVHYIYGKTCTGKTRMAYEYDPELYRVASLKPEWWDGYNSELTVLLDDVTYIPDVSRFLQLTDKYRIQVPVKGAFRWLHATRIYITSNLSPETLFAGFAEETQAALMRRLTTVTGL